MLPRLLSRLSHSHPVLRLQAIRSHFSTMSSNTPTVALVTGANQGIGRAIVSSLIQRHSSSPHSLTPLIVYLAGRNPQSVSTAVSEVLSELGPIGDHAIKPLTLDITDPSTIQKAVATVSHDYGYLDILINNAGIATKGDAFDEDIARNTSKTNYTGTFNVTSAFLPLIRKGGRIVNVSSTVGQLRTVSPELAKRFSDPSLTFSELDKLMEEFFTAVKEGDYKEKGWPRSAYGVSKVGLTAQTRILARTPTVKEKELLVVSCCPGWIRTNMAGPRATGTVEEGARTPVWLALGERGEILENGKWGNGEFYRDLKRVEW